MQEGIEPGDWHGGGRGGRMERMSSDPKRFVTVHEQDVKMP